MLPVPTLPCQPQLAKGTFLPLPPALWAPTSALCTAHIQLGLAQPEWETQALGFKALSEPAMFTVEVKEMPVNSAARKWEWGRGGAVEEQEVRDQMRNLQPDNQAPWQARYPTSSSS